MEEGDIYRDHDDALVFRVIEVRGDDPDSVVAVEVLDEAVETYRTRREIVEGMESGAIERAEDVDHEEFEREDPDVPLREREVAAADWLKYAAAGLVVVTAISFAFPATRIFAVLMVKIAVPFAVFAAAAYVVYRHLTDEE